MGRRRFGKDAMVANLERGGRLGYDSSYLSQAVLLAGNTLEGQRSFWYTDGPFGGNSMD
jgi:hypothetical protein